MEYYQNASKLAGFNETGDDPNLMMIRIVDTLICEVTMATTNRPTAHSKLFALFSFNSQKAEGLAIPQWAKDNYDKYLEIFNYAFQRDLRTPKTSKFFAGKLVVRS